MTKTWQIYAAGVEVDKSNLFRGYFYNHSPSTYKLKKSWANLSIIPQYP